MLRPYGSSSANPGSGEPIPETPAAPSKLSPAPLAGYHGRMVRTLYYASASLDGFDTAGLHPARFPGQETAASGTVASGTVAPGTAAETAVSETGAPPNAGAVVMGARTYARLQRQVLESGPSGWDCPPGAVWVYTHQEFPGIEGADIMFVRGPVAEFAADIEDSAGGADIWLRGADLAGQYLREGLLDELHLTLRPLLLGSGHPPLPAAAEQHPQLLASRPAPDGSIHLHYRFPRRGGKGN